MVHRPGSFEGERPAEVPDLRRHQRGARARAGRGHEGVDPGDAGRRHHPDRVHDRAQRAQRFGQLVPGGLVTEEDQPQHGEALPAQRLGDHGQRLGDHGQRVGIRSRRELPAALVPR